MNADLIAQFEDIYRAHSRTVMNIIVSRMYQADTHLAEDLTAETFLTYWRKMTAGVEIQHPRAMLILIAERVIVDHFRPRRSREAATDFGVTNATEVASGAAGTPHLAGLFEELEQAKDVLSVAAGTYRALDSQYRSACGTAANARRPETVARCVERKAMLAEARADALAEFSAAGRAVGLARAAWNANASDVHGLLAVSDLKAGVR